MTREPTEVIIIGTTHGRHHDAKRYTAAELERVLLATQPDAIAVEMESGSFPADGRIHEDECNYQDFPELRAIAKASRELEVTVFPFDREGKNEYYQETRYSDRLNRALEEKAKWVKRLQTQSPGCIALELARCLDEAINAQEALSREAPSEIVNSEAYDCVVRVKHALLFSVLPELMKKDAQCKGAVEDYRFLANEWNERNQSMADNIVAIASQLSGRRLAVTTGGDHRFILRDLLADKPGITLKEFWEVLP